MNLTPEQRDQVAAEVKRFAMDLHLSDDQKNKLQSAFTDARSRVGDYLQEHPGITRADIAKQVMSHRDQIRQRVTNFLTPDQLKMWDAEVGKAKQFLGHSSPSDLPTRADPDLTPLHHLQSPPDPVKWADKACPSPSETK
jgi:protein CpxP